MGPQDRTSWHESVCSDVMWTLKPKLCLLEAYLLHIFCVAHRKIPICSKKDSILRTFKSTIIIIWQYNFGLGCIFRRRIRNSRSSVRTSLSKNLPSIIPFVLSATMVSSMVGIAWIYPNTTTKEPLHGLIHQTKPIKRRRKLLTPKQTFFLSNSTSQGRSPPWFTLASRRRQNLSEQHKPSKPKAKIETRGKRLVLLNETSCKHPLQSQVTHNSRETAQAHVRVTAWPYAKPFWYVSYVW